MIARAARRGLLAIFLASCSSQSAPSTPATPPTLSIREGTDPVVGQALSSTGLSLAVGIVVELDATLDGYADGTVLSARADNPTCLDVIPFASGNAFALVGVAPGSTVVRFFVDGQAVTSFAFAGTSGGTIPVTVEPQVVEP